MAQFDYLALSVELPDPLFNDKIEHQVQRVQRKTRHGQLITFRDASWSKIETRKLAFDGLSDTQRSDMKNFVEQSLGKQITYTQNLVAYTAMIINPNGRFTEVFRTCGHTFELWLMIFP